MCVYYLLLVLISTSTRSVDQTLPLATIDTYSPEGYVFFVERGMSGKLCAADFETDIPNEKMTVALQTIATSLCRTLNYQWVRIHLNNVHMVNVKYAFILHLRETAPQ